jgi:hypothetical protein
MTAEAYALREGLCLAQHLECNRIVVRSDNMMVVETMREERIASTAAAAIFHDCTLMASGFSKVTFEHFPKEANSVTHELAKFCFQSISLCTWDDDPPSFILPLLINGVTVFDHQ